MLGGIGAGGEGDDRRWDGWMTSLTRWMWVRVNSWSWWWTGRPGLLQYMGLQRIRHNWATEMNRTELMSCEVEAHRQLLWECKNHSRDSFSEVVENRAHCEARNLPALSLNIWCCSHQVISHCINQCETWGSSWWNQVAHYQVLSYCTWHLKKWSETERLDTSSS